MRWRHTMWIAGVLLAWPLYAAPVCPPSASFEPYDYPGPRAIPTTNNLILPTGKSIPAEGQALTLRGRVLDRECKPVVEAMVELWQAGPFGRWGVAGPIDLATPGPVFAGAGRTYTDRDGSFTFITAFPAPLRYRAPNLNVRIKPEGMNEYTTALFFDNDMRNDSEEGLRKLGNHSRSDISIHVQPGKGDSLTGDITLVLSGKAPYRTY